MTTVGYPACLICPACQSAVTITDTVALGGPGQGEVTSNCERDNCPVMALSLNDGNPDADTDIRRHSQE